MERRSLILLIHAGDMCESLLKKLESFQRELAKQILKWPKCLSNTAAVTCSDLPSTQFRILVSKLGLRVRLLKKDGEDLDGSVVLSLCDDFHESFLVGEGTCLEPVSLVRLILKDCSGDVK